MGPKYDLGSQTLSTLSTQTDTSHTDLGTLVKRLVAAAEPFEGKFNGSGRVAFDRFKENVDQISQDLNNSLAKILEGQTGMDTSFQTGDQDMADNANQKAATASFDSARFGKSQG